MTKETRELLHKFMDRYEDMREINELDYEHFIMETLYCETKSDTVKELCDILNLYKKSHERKEIYFPLFLNCIIEEHDKFYNHSNINARKNKRRYSRSLLSKSGDITAALKECKIEKNDDLDLQILFSNQKFRNIKSPIQENHQLQKKYTFK